MSVEKKGTCVQKASYLCPCYVIILCYFLSLFLRANEKKRNCTICILILGIGVYISAPDLIAHSCKVLSICSVIIEETYVSWVLLFQFFNPI